ncbi:MAG: UDP-N-acetyl-D-glucosamine dehydrogenase, partial [Deltaproteobacteria bacterium]|nr:UDP-N-acetyl-D-glucosamine dehydrogenase [Deltaproteobacteria bacterium]
PEWKTERNSYRCQKFTAGTLKACDCAVIVTDHSEFDYRQIVASAPLIVDTRNATKGLPQKKVVRL